MQSSEQTLECLNCERSEIEIPLVALRHRGRQAWICSQCLPLLIHHPHRLAGRLEQANTITPVPPDAEL